MLFFGCPHCKQKISTNEARTRLNIICADPVESEEMLKHCVDLEQRYGAEAPLEILLQIQAYHPHNEAVAYSIVRMSGYRSDFVRQYLKNFCAARKQVPFAEDFLDNILIPQYAPLVNYLSQYIENKLPESKQKKYRELLNELKTNYVGRSVSGEGMGLMYAYYCAGAVLNVGLLILFILLPLKIYFNLIIAVAVFAIEIFVLFLHNKTYGNRIEMSPREKIYMIVFLCSIVVAIGGIFIGAMVKV